MTADRIAVIGISGSGKSTFAKALSARTGLPVLHGDQLEWLENWSERPPAELEAMHAEWLARPRWIIEGWIEPDRAARLNAADVVVDLDYSGSRCAWRVLGRMLRGVRRDEMPEGCVDRFGWQFLKRVFRKEERPSVDGALKTASMRRYLRFATPAQAQAWLESL